VPARSVARLTNAVLRLIAAAQERGQRSVKHLNAGQKTAWTSMIVQVVAVARAAD
jgi:hypothetical protein